jgi:hypothetical protein
MPVHVGEMTSEVSVADGELPLSPGQLEQVVAAVLRQLEQRDRDRRDSKEATVLRASATPALKTQS